MDRAIGPREFYLRGPVGWGWAALLSDWVDLQKLSTEARTQLLPIGPAMGKHQRGPPEPHRGRLLANWGPLVRQS